MCVRCHIVCVCVFVLLFVFVCLSVFFVWGLVCAPVCVCVVLSNVWLLLTVEAKVEPGSVAHPSLSAWALLQLSFLWGHAGCARHGQFSNDQHVHTVRQFFLNLLFIICRGGFRFKINLLDTTKCRYPRPYPNGDFDVFVIKDDGTVDMDAWAQFGGYDTNNLRHAFLRRCPYATFLDLWMWAQTKDCPWQFFHQMFWQVGLRLQHIVSEVLKGAKYDGLESKLVDVAALLCQPQALDRALARYTVSLREVFSPAINISLCTDKASVTSMTLQNTIFALPDNRAGIAPPQACFFLFVKSYTLQLVLKRFLATSSSACA